MKDEITITNHEQIIQALKFKNIEARKILLLSPSLFDVQLIRKIFPGSSIYVALFEDWNLNDMPPNGIGSFDLAIASNVFMYSENPRAWFSNLLETANIVVLQDIKYRKRSNKFPYLGLDADKVRYTNKLNNYFNVEPNQPTFELCQLSNVEIVYYNEYDGALNEYHSIVDIPIHIVVVIKKIKSNYSGKNKFTGFFTYIKLKKNLFNFYLHEVVATINNKIKILFF